MSKGSGEIGFPGLGIKDFNLSNVAFRVFGIEIYWYGIVIALGFLCGVLLAYRSAKKHGENPDNIIDMALISTPLAIVFARLYYVVFELKSYSSFYDVINIREGGLAIYGAVIGAVISAFIYCKVKKVSFGRYMDITIPGLLLGQAIGRWGNFFNQEAFGADTTLPWRMRLYIVENYQLKIHEVHPTFFYESLWDAIGVILLVLLLKKKKFNGEVVLAYFAWYGLGRMFVEGLRTDSLMLGNSIRVSQVFAGATMVISIVLIVLLRVLISKKKLVIKADDKNAVVESLPQVEVEAPMAADDKEAIKENTEETGTEQETAESGTNS